MVGLSEGEVSSFWAWDFDIGVFVVGGFLFGDVAGGVAEGGVDCGGVCDLFFVFFAAADCG